jgi:hypothetical protein
MVKYFRLAVLVLLGFAAASRADVDLLQRYPTQLITGDPAPENARPWEFTPADVFRVSRFSFAVSNELTLELGVAELGIGHCADGAVWAVVLPRASGTLSRGVGDQTPVAHVWFRFHPGQINRLFPPETVSAGSATNLFARIRTIANAKFNGSWHAGAKALIPNPPDVTLDLDTSTSTRRFFVVDTEAKTMKYIAAFEDRAVRQPAPFSAELAAEGFDKLWQAFDEEYAMFILRPELDWSKLREQYRPKALACTTTEEFAAVCADVLKPLRDLHVWMTVGGANVPVFNRPRRANSNPSAHRVLLGELHRQGRVQWVVTEDKIGFIAINGWNTGPEIPAQVDAALEQMRDTRGLIVDVRLNGGGDEPTASKVAGRFLQQDFVYAYSRFRNGPIHTNLTEKFPRTIGPRGPWRYHRPVVLLIGEKCMSSNESFIAMMSGATNVTTMGDHTCGSSGNPRIVKLPLDMTVSVPRWIDYLPDGTPLDEKGFQPEGVFKPSAGAFEGNRDDLLTAALERLRQLPLPEAPIEGEAFVPDATTEPTSGRPPVDVIAELRAAAQEEARDASRPKIVSLTPNNGASSVAAITELRVRFDRAMDPLALKLSWESGGFLDCEYPRYDSNRFEFTIPVYLAPGMSHRVVLNKPFTWFPGVGQKIAEQRQQWPREGFQSAEHRQAGLVVWEFSTQGAEALPTGEPPKVTAISPKPGSTVALLTFAEIQFDQPMLPPTEARPCVVSVVGAKNPGAICRVEYNPTNRTFRIPLLSPLKDRVRFTLAGHTVNVPPMLTPRGRVSFALTGFQSAKGVPAAPVKLDYAVAETELAVGDRKRIEAAAKDPKLLAVLDALKQKRSELKSVAERVQQLDLEIRSNLFTSLKSQSAVFKWQSPDRFYGDVSQPMLSCDFFRIGSDGQRWWFHAELANRKTLQICPVADMHEVNALFGDPFGLTRQSPAEAAEERGLNYVGPMNFAGVEHHLIEAWSVENVSGMTVWGELTQWWLDPRTALPAQIVQFRDSGLERTRFLYDAVNETLPASDFAVPQGEGLSPEKPEALDADYTKRFVTIRDGSDGRMSARWGKQGPKGTSSGGLN